MVYESAYSNPEQNHKSCLASITRAPFPTSGKAPRHPWKVLAKLIEISVRERKLTSTHSEPGIWYVTAHASALCADEQPAVPGIRK